MRTKLLIIFALLCSSTPALAYYGDGGSAGAVASNLTQTAHLFTGVFSSIFYVIGIMFVMASIMQYRQFRQNSSQTPLSRVIVLLLAGIIIGFFPWGSQWISQYLSTFNV